MPSTAQKMLLLRARTTILPDPEPNLDPEGEADPGRIIPPETLMFVFSDVLSPAMFGGGGSGNTFDVPKDITPPRMVSPLDFSFDTTPPNMISGPSEFDDRSYPGMVASIAIQSDGEVPNMSALNAPQTYFN